MPGDPAARGLAAAGAMPGDAAARGATSGGAAAGDVAAGGGGFGGAAISAPSAPAFERAATSGVCRRGGTRAAL